MNLTYCRKIVLLMPLLFIATYSFGQSITLSDEAKVSVITCGTGNESYSLFGHTALRVSDPVQSVDMVYNYGAFDFSTPNFVMKFIKGDLQYFAVVHPYLEFINQYVYEQRSVYEQELDISLAMKQKLFDNLNTSLASGDSHYTYKFIDKNCTSMVVDLINKTLNSTVIFKKTETSFSYRSILFPYFDGHFYEKLGTSIIFGRKVDEKGTKIFLPFELFESLKKVPFQNRLLINQSKTIIEFNKEIPLSWWNNFYSYIITLLCIAFINKKAVNLFYLSIIALLGLFFAWMSLYSLHAELAYNYNILLFNPTLLGFLYLYWIKNKKGIYNLALLNILFLIIYIFTVVTKAHFLVVLPLIVCNGYILGRMAIKNKKRIPIII